LTFADRVIEFNRTLRFTKELPEGISIMNPFLESSEALRVSEIFYRKYYSDNRKRKIILGINPGRFGAGITGIPFTDIKRLKDVCGIDVEGISSHETSSVFVYDLIERYGGPDQFYSNFYINSVCPLGFVKLNNRGKEVNYNYYDDRELTMTVMDFITESLKSQLSFGIERSTGYCLGTGKNFSFLAKLNEKLDLFDRVIPLEHPRYIMQYRLKSKENYINSFLKLLR